MWFKQNIAALLTVSRIPLSVAASVLIIMAVWWPDLMTWAVWLVAIASVTEAIDGRIARYFGVRKHYWPFTSPEQMSELITGIFLCGVVPAAILVHLFIVLLRDFSVWMLVAWITWLVICVFYLGMTKLFFEKGRKVLLARAAERLDVAQAWFAGLIVLSCVFVMSWLQRGLAATLEPDMLKNAAIVCLLVFGLSSGRQFARPHERVRGAYRHGTKTFEEFILGV